MIVAAQSAVIDIPAGWAILAGAVVTGVLAIFSTVVVWWLRQIEKRSDAQQALLDQQAARIQKLEARDRTSWIYVQRLILHANTHAPGVPIPEPPSGWLEDD